MKYYLDRLEVIKALNEAQVEYDENYKGLGKAKEIVDNLPTVDFVAELEEIEAEVNNIQIETRTETCAILKTAKDMRHEVLWILNKRIKEINNEQKED